MRRTLKNFQLTAMPFGRRAPELLKAALTRLEGPASIPSLCAAAILTADGTIHVARTEILIGEPVRHALAMAVLQVLRADDHRIQMAVIVSREGDGPPQLMLPCGYCRTSLYPYGGSEIRIVNTDRHARKLTLVDMDELLPYAEGGPGRVFPPKIPHD